MRAIYCVVNGLLPKFGLKRSASCVPSSSKPLRVLSYFDWKFQIIAFLLENDSQKVLRKLPVSSRNVSKLPPGAPRGRLQNASGRSPGTS